MDLDAGVFSLTEQGATDIRAHPRLPAMTIPPDWTRAVRVQDLPDDITVTTWNGGADTAWTIRGEAPPMVCVGILLEGTLTMTPDSGPALTLGPGTIVLHAAAQGVSGQDVLRAEGTLRLVDVRFAAEAFLPIIAGSLVPVLRDAILPGAETCGGAGVFRHAPASPAARRTATDILSCQDFEGVARALFLRAKALELLAVVLRDTMPHPRQAVPARDRKRVVTARRLLERDYATPWTIERLSREVGLSEKKLRVGFRQIIGASVQDHLRSVRLAAAMAMLERGQSVTETAYAVGFSSLSHFSKAFKDHAGLSPRDWARRCPGV
ncbi:helix-turn-helix transcriptional regulator [Roseospira marina]|uniref:Helix-turn-helix transcriptional regulator n=1 Tax=Roseospira marina TaxID=140057 RepID=A0A5M6I982_9PROT|nr:AraC family transcriptional regulator [Roseospira marina]KAA5604228.1 helix-turn-helix transcriptional regulator [Roseospira marina]MBB4315626.1 AraC-like DNA-binding protein [Roseospira marina]MBB5088622.1 AraC-like DNA-binding protein [Roseospira marina]